MSSSSEDNFLRDIYGALSEAKHLSQTEESRSAQPIFLENNTLDIRYFSETYHGINILEFLGMLQAHPHFVGFLDGVETIKLPCKLDKENLEPYKKILEGFSNPNFTVKNIIVDSINYSIKDEIREINILSGIRCSEYRYSKTPFEDNVCREFVIKILAFHAEGKNIISKEELVATLNTICKDLRYPDGNELSYNKALRIISEFPGGIIDSGELVQVVEGRDKSQPPVGIITATKNLLSELKIPSETYTLQYAEDLHFNMVRITKDNVEAWKALAETSKENIKSGHAAGVSTFVYATEPFDNPGTEVWVACATPKPFSSKKPLDKSEIEMMLTVTTSDNSPFTTHMGIQRLPTETNHRNLSSALHTFGAAFMQHIHPEKQYMINTPTPIMREIMSEAFAKKGETDAVSLYYSEHLKPKNETMLKQEWSFVKNAKENAAIIKGLQKIYEQQEALSRGKCICPIEKQPLPNGGFNFIIHDINGGKDIVITPEQQVSEFAWFFGHVHQRDKPESPMVIIAQEKLECLVEDLSLDRLQHFIDDQRVHEPEHKKAAAHIPSAPSSHSVKQTAADASTSAQHVIKKSWAKEIIDEKSLSLNQKHSY